MEGTILERGDDYPFYSFEWRWNVAAWVLLVAFP